MKSLDRRHPDGHLEEEKIMPDIMQDPLRGLSDALLERVRGAQPLVARIEVEGRSVRSGTLWRKDVVVAADQAFARVDEAKVVLGDGSSFSAHLAGRERGRFRSSVELEGNNVGAGIATRQMRCKAAAVTEYDLGLFDISEGLLRSDDDVFTPEGSRTHRASFYLDTRDQGLRAPDALDQRIG